MTTTFLSKKNNGSSTISNVGGIASGATSVSIQAGDTGLFPSSGNFEVTMWPAGSNPTAANSEIVLVTAGQGTQTFTITRAQEGASAKTFAQNDNIALLSTAKFFTDLETQVQNVQTELGDLANYVHSGLTAPTSASLATTISAGIIYYGGVQVSVASDGGHTYTASNDCYVDVSNAGAYTYNTVANGAAAPALTANSIRIAKVVTSGTAVTTVTQDGSLDSLGNVIYPNKPAATLNGTETLRNKRRTRRLVTVTQSATPAINSDNTDIAKITGLAQAITSFTTNLSGTPNDGDLLEIRITDNGTARALTFGSSFEATTVALPTTTVISTELKILFEWNATASKWDCVATA